MIQNNINVFLNNKLEEEVGEGVPGEARGGKGQPVVAHCHTEPLAIRHVSWITKKKYLEAHVHGPAKNFLVAVNSEQRGLGRLHAFLHHRE